MSSNDDKYPEPEGWGDDGFWRDPAIDSDYETGLTSPVRPAQDGPRADPGYSYWSDGKGWENSPGTGAASGAPSGGASPFDATRYDATRAAFGPGEGGLPGNGNAAEPTAFYGGSGGPTGAYGAGPAGPFGPGGPVGPGGPGGPGPGGPGRGRGGPGGPRGRRRGDWWRRWTWKKALAVTGSAFVVFILALVGVYYYFANSAEIPTAFAANVLDQSTTVYYSDGHTVLGTIGTVDRQDLTISQIPKGMQDAAISAEDRGFWTEGGISPTGILRAAYDDLTSSGGSLSGGSTITQQFVRNYYSEADVGTQQTISRKIKEIFIAQKLATTKSKPWILQNYLNVIYLGDGSYGVQAAAETYFGVPVSKLTVAQDAVIAAIIQQPSTYYQPQYRTDLVARWHYVLNGMVTIGDLSQARADSMTFPKLLTDSPSYNPPGLSQGCSTRSTEPWASYLMTQICGELTTPVADGGDGVSSNELDNGGLKVITTVSLPMEKEMYKAVNENIAQMPQTEENDGLRNIGLPSWALIGAELQDPKTGAILAMYPGRGQNMSKKKCALYDCDQNTTLTREQVGSSFKPYVLSTAVSEGMNVQDSILNSSEFLCVSSDYTPMEYSQAIPAAVYDEPGSNTGCKASQADKIENDGGGAIGTPVGPKGDGLWKSTVQYALAQSSNTAFTDLEHRATTASTIQMAQNFGVDIDAYPSGSGLTDRLHQVPAVALGEASLTVNEQTQMLATIDDNGVYHAGHVVKSWQRPDQTAQTPIVATHVVLQPAQDSEVQYAMEDTTYGGTADNAADGLGGRQIIAKTGTTSNYLSGFFIGAIPQYALVVGLFVNQQDSSNLSANNLSDLGGGGFGGFWPANIWNTFAQAEWAKLTPASFPNPQFSGQLWNQIGPIPKAKKKKNKCTVTLHGRTFPIPGKGCKNPTQTPTPNPTHTHPTGFPTFPGSSTTPTPTPTPTPTTTGPTSTSTPTSTPTAPTTATSTPGSPGGGGPGPGTTQTASGVKAGMAAGGMLVALLPGSLLWTSASRRRRKRRTGANR